MYLVSREGRDRRGGEKKVCSILIEEQVAMTSARVQHVTVPARFLTMTAHFVAVLTVLYDLVSQDHKSALRE